MFEKNFTRKQWLRALQNMLTSKHACKISRNRFSKCLFAGFFAKYFQSLFQKLLEIFFICISGNNSKYERNRRPEAYKAILVPRYLTSELFLHVLHFLDALEIQKSQLVCWRWHQFILKYAIKLPRIVIDRVWFCEQSGFNFVRPGTTKLIRAHYFPQKPVSSRDFGKWERRVYRSRNFGASTSVRIQKS